MAGTFRIGPTTVQSMYALEFAAHSAGAVMEATPGESPATSCRRRANEVSFSANELSFYVVNGSEPARHRSRLGVRWRRVRPRDLPASLPEPASRGTESLSRLRRSGQP
jgi:hypothetical protein